ncbi:MAG: GIY-YIG nuclease family protein [Candidatus Yanofskybacteria bacterium]|nr:GIY-YIG nuclease family protein [Candidatus Yanofskybacteria bacterium]
MHYVYVLKCANGTVYTGCTNNIEDRLKRHGNGRVFATKNRLPINLICYTVFENKYTAYNFEKYLKSGSGRAFLSKHLI